MEGVWEIKFAFRLVSHKTRENIFRTISLWWTRGKNVSREGMRGLWGEIVSVYVCADVQEANNDTRQSYDNTFVQPNENILRCKSRATFCSICVKEIFITDSLRFSELFELHERTIKNSGQRTLCLHIDLHKTKCNSILLKSISRLIEFSLFRGGQQPNYQFNPLESLNLISHKTLELIKLNALKNLRRDKETNVRLS